VDVNPKLESYWNAVSDKHTERGMRLYDAPVVDNQVTICSASLGISLAPMLAEQSRRLYLKQVCNGIIRCRREREIDIGKL